MSVATLLHVEQNWEGVCQYGDFITREVRAYSSLPRRKGKNLSFPLCQLKRKKFAGLLSLTISQRLACSNNSSK